MVNIRFEKEIHATHFLQNISFISPVWRSLNKDNSYKANSQSPIAENGVKNIHGPAYNLEGFLFFLKKNSGQNGSDFDILIQYIFLTIQTNIKFISDISLVNCFCIRNRLFKKREFAGYLINMIERNLIDTPFLFFPICKKHL